MADTAAVGAAPIAGAERVTNLDTVRGVATLGILLMNIVSFGLPFAGYFNVDAAGSETWFDYAVGVMGEVLVDQKTMGLFSLLFGVGIVVFADRAEAKGRHALRLSLWRNLLLLGIGFLHSLLWDGDILVVYAACAPVLLLLRKRRARTLVALGAAMLMVSVGSAAVSQLLIDRSTTGYEAELGDMWFVTNIAIGDIAGLNLLVDFYARSLGMMLIGVALFQTGIVQGLRPAAFYRQMAVWGLGIGIPLATAGVVWNHAADWSASTALIGLIPNTLATAPVALGYLAVITLWNQRPTTPRHERIRAVGRMALTNYLSQTVLGIVLLRVVFDQGEFGRLVLLGVVVSIWVVQVAWSQPWLERFRFGPCEWLWRVATYRQWQPIRREQ